MIGQEFIVFPRRTLQTNFDDCKSCLHLYDHVHCHLGCRVWELRDAWGFLGKTSIKVGHNFTKSLVGKGKSAKLEVFWGGCSTQRLDRGCTPLESFKGFRACCVVFFCFGEASSSRKTLLLKGVDTTLFHSQTVSLSH